MGRIVVGTRLPKNTLSELKKIAGASYTTVSNQIAKIAIDFLVKKGLDRDYLIRDETEIIKKKKKKLK